MRVSCFGSGKNTSQALYEEMKAVGRLLALRGIAIATGAYGGVGMQAALEGAAESGVAGRAIGCTYGGQPANEYVTETIDCRVLAKDIPFDAEYCVRMAALLTSEGFIVAGGGGPGTFLELIATINFNEKFWRPRRRVAILEIRDAPEAWNNSMVAQLAKWGVLSDEVSKVIRIVDTAEKAVEWVIMGNHDDVQ
jgi:predicted Rossmann-fold nucleotide-binding protein